LIRMFTSGQERIRLDQNGNLLVGKTAAGATTAGVELAPAGIGVFTYAGRPLYLNRLTSDGDVIEFAKDGSTVGSIGAYSGDVYIAEGDTGLRFNADNDLILPFNGSSGSLATRDAAIDLGTTGGRFKDLYLSGGAYLGGTAAANHLDDYEEGTWTPTLPNGGTLTVQSATYTKIGRQVNVRGYIQNISPTANTSQFAIGGLPFTTSNDGYGAGSISYSASFDVSGLGLLNSISNSYLYFHYIDGTTGASLSNNNWISQVNSTSGQLIFQITYYT